MSLPRTARFAIGMSAALAAVSVAAALTQPSADETGFALAVVPSPDTVFVPTTTALQPPPTTTTAPPPASPTTVVTIPTTTSAPHVAAAPSTTTRVVASSGSRESCGWSWDATHFDDGSLNEVTLLLDAPRRPNALVTITAKPGASLPTISATTTDQNGQASMLVHLSNDKRDWTLTISAVFLGSTCDTRTFTISY